MSNKGKGIVFMPLKMYEKITLKPKERDRKVEFTHISGRLRE